MNENTKNDKTITKFLFQYRLRIDELKPRILKDKSINSCIPKLEKLDYDKKNKMTDKCRDKLSNHDDFSKFIKN